MFKIQSSLLYIMTRNKSDAFSCISPLNYLTKKRNLATRKINFLINLLLISHSTCEQMQLAELQKADFYLKTSLLPSASRTQASTYLTGRHHRDTHKCTCMHTPSRGCVFVHVYTHTHTEHVWLSTLAFFSKAGMKCSHLKNVITPSLAFSIQLC